MISLHRTTDAPPLAVLATGVAVLLFPWSDLLALRELAAEISPEAAGDEDLPRIERGPWAASGSSFGIALERDGAGLFLEAEEWIALREALYGSSALLSQMDVAGITGRPQQRVSDAIMKGSLFAFQVPGLARRKWRIPRSAAESWMRERSS